MTTASLAEVVTAPWRDEKTFERAAKAIRFYRALADAIEADPDLAPTLTADSTNGQFYRNTFDDAKPFTAGARRLLGTRPQIAEGFWIDVNGELAGVPVKFRTAVYGLPKRKVVREVEVEEYVLDEDTL